VKSLTHQRQHPRATRPVGEPRLRTHHLTKRYPGGVVANDDIDLSLTSGTVCALLGPNGAGKTTLVKQVIGLLAPTSGSIMIDGHDVVTHADAARRLCSFQPQAQMSLDGLTPRTAIELVGRIRGGGRTETRQRAGALIEALDLGDWADRDGARLSGGIKRLTGFAMAAVVPGRVVLLDEPTNDVDPIRRRLLWDQVRALAAEGSAVLVATHNLDEVETVAARFVVMSHGRIVGDASPRSITESSEGLHLALNVIDGVTLPSPPAAISSLVASHGQVTAVVTELEMLEALGWAESLRMQGLVSGYEVGSSTLDDVYTRLVADTEGI
jgi:ABC-2 type transport system ATP-binding protein